MNLDSHPNMDGVVSHYYIEVPGVMDFKITTEEEFQSAFSRGEFRYYPPFVNNSNPLSQDFPFKALHYQNGELVHFWA